MSTSVFAVVVGTRRLRGGDPLLVTAPTALAGTPVTGETPSGAVDGVNAIFALSQAPDPTTSLNVFRTGLLQTPGADYTLSGAYVTFLSGSIPLPGDTLLADYRYTSSGTPVTMVRVKENETPAGAVDGANATFTLVNAPLASALELYVEGVRQVPGLQYTISGSTITFIAGSIPEPGDVLRGTYRY